MSSLVDTYSRLTLGGYEMVIQEVIQVLEGCQAGALPGLPYSDPMTNLPL